MDRVKDPFVALVAETSPGELARLERRGTCATQARHRLPATAVAPAVGRLQGFDLLDRPLVARLAACAGQVMTARATLPLVQSMIGRDVLVLFEDGDLQAPIIVGVIQTTAAAGRAPPVEPGVTVYADGERYLVSAERELVLRCGDASITLTRAGKIVIKGNYILSRSTGYHKIKGAAVDIN